MWEGGGGVGECKVGGGGCWASCLVIWLVRWCLRPTNLHARHDYLVQRIREVCREARHIIGAQLELVSEVIPLRYQVGIDVVAQHRRQALHVTADIDHPDTAEKLDGGVEVLLRVEP